MSNQNCPVCGKSLACTNCNGAGKIRKTVDDCSWRICCDKIQDTEICMYCNGITNPYYMLGMDKPCPICNGTGINQFHNHGVIVDTLRVKNF